MKRHWHVGTPVRPTKRQKGVAFMLMCVRVCVARVRARVCGGYKGVVTCVCVCVPTQCVRECTRLSDRSSHCIMPNESSSVVIEANPIMSRAENLRQVIFRKRITRRIKSGIGVT